MRYEFKGKVTRWQANPKFFLVAMPKKYFKEINELGETLRRGWGSVRVSAWIGKTGWQTSIFPSSEAVPNPLRPHPLASRLNLSLQRTHPLQPHR